MNIDYLQTSLPIRKGTFIAQWVMRGNCKSPVCRFKPAHTCACGICFFGEESLLGHMFQMLNVWIAVCSVLSLAINNSRDINLQTVERTRRRNDFGGEHVNVSIEKGSKDVGAHGAFPLRKNTSLAAMFNTITV